MRTRSVTLVLAVAVLGTMLLSACTTSPGRIKSALNGADLVEGVGAEDHEAVFKRGIEARTAGDLPEAERLLAAAYRANPESKSYALELAVAHEWQGELEEARRIYRRVAAKWPDDTGAQLGLGRTERWLGRLTTAKRLYHKLVRKDPSQVEARNGLAFVSMYDKRLARARRQFNEVLRDHPDNEEAKTGLEQLSAIRRYELQIGQRRQQIPGGSSIDIPNAAFKAELSAKYTFMADYFGRSRRATGLDATGSRIDRDIRHQFSAGLLIKPDPSRSVQGKYALLRMFDGSTQHRLHMEAGQDVGEGGRVFAGFQPTWGGGQLFNTLTYLGGVIPLADKHQLQAQVFYATDFEEDDGRAVSLTWFHFASEDLWLKFGASYGESGPVSTKLVYGQVNVDFTRDLGIYVGGTGNVDTGESELEVGLRIRFP